MTSGKTLFAWAQEVGIYISPRIGPAALPGKGLGLVAILGPIPKGTTLLRIPRSLWLCSQRMSTVHTAYHAERAMAQRLVDIRNDPSHLHHPYATHLSVAPVERQFNSESDFETEEVRDKWREYQTWPLPPWALYHTLSRAHYARQHLNLIPVMDLVNHEGNAPNCAYEIRGVPPKYVNMCFYSVRELAVGEECVYPYSSFDPQSAASRDRWRLYAGFLPRS